MIKLECAPGNEHCVFVDVATGERFGSVPARYAPELKQLLGQGIAVRDAEVTE